MSNDKYINVILSYSVSHADICGRMINCAHNAGLKITHVVHAEDVRQGDAVELLTDYRDRFGDEIVMWLSPDKQMQEECGIQEVPNFFCYYSWEDKQKLARALVELYRNAFGQGFEAAAFFNLDAASLQAFKEVAPELVTVVALVFEEGINVLRGHRYFDLEWTCLTEGGPWWPWVPRRGNATAPAGPKDEKIDLVCVPHLMRDMIQSFDARDDFFSSQPMDEMRSKSVWPGNIEYTRRFFAEHLRQAEFNHGYAYYQFFEGFGPSDPESPHVFDEDSDEFAKVFEQYVAFLGEQVKNGAVQQISMSGFGKWFLKRFGGCTPSTVTCWKDIRFDSGKEYVWYLDANVRALFAANHGGAILDLRPYGAKVAKEAAGIDTDYLWDLSYPFVIQNHHRYTSICKTMLKYNGILRDLGEEFLTVRGIERKDSSTVIRYEPLSLAFGDMQCDVDVSCTVQEEGKIMRAVTIRSPSRNGGTMEFCEYFHGTWGTTDLPTDLAGLVLKASGKQGEYGMVYSHRGRKIELENAGACSVGFPKDNFTLALSTEAPNCIGQVQEGTLFQTFYTLSLEASQELRDGISFVTCISFQRGPVTAEGLDDSSAKPSWKGRQPFKTAWGPSLHPLRCPRCLMADREVHLIERGGIFRCQFCSFVSTREEIQRRYEEMRRENYG